MSTEKNLTADELTKGLALLEAAASASTGGRGQELLQKAQTGELSAEERSELIKSLTDDSLATKASAALKGNDTIQKSLDVSDYLREQHQGLVSGLEMLAGHLEKAQVQEHEFRKALATTVVQMAGLIKSQQTELEEMRKSLDNWGTQPARAPRSVTSASQVLNKSFAGGDAAGEQLSKSQISDALSEMLEKGMDAAGGESLLKAATKYEVTNTISPPVLAAVKQHLASRGGKAA